MQTPSGNPGLTKVSTLNTNEPLRLFHVFLSKPIHTDLEVGMGDQLTSEIGRTPEEAGTDSDCADEERGILTV